MDDLMPEDLRDGVDNDSLMLSLPVLSRETGIPMPVILRLQAQHPDEIPAVGAGSQKFFPQGVLPALKTLYEEERGNGNSARSGIYSLARQRRESQEAQEGRMRSAPKQEEQARKRPEGQETADSHLLVRLEELDARMRRLTSEIADLIVEMRRPREAKVELL